MTRFSWLVFSLLFLAAPAPGLAQGAQIAFGTAQEDSDLPVEVTSEILDVNQNDGTAVFTGSVIVAQGEMRLYAPRVLVVYKEDESGVDRFEATGGVTVVSGEDAAESRSADYFVDSGMIEMNDDVLLVRGPQVLTSDKMVVNRFEGTAQMTGNVKTVLQSDNNQDGSGGDNN